MFVHRIAAALILVLAASVSACRSSAVEPGADRTMSPPPAPTGDAPRPADAIAKSLPFLLTDGDAWMRGRIPIQEGKSCVSCHVVALAVWSHAEAQRHGVDVPGTAVDDLSERAAAFLADPDQGAPVSWGQLLLGRVDRDPAADARWAPIVERILAAQQPEGHWVARGQFPSQRRPESESDAVATLWTILALSSLHEADDAVRRSIERARAWLRDAEPGRGTEWIAWRLRVAHRMGEPTDPWRQQLVERRNPDGGWGFLEGESSDAYTTGQVLYVLRRSGVDDEAMVAEAVAYLLGTQQADGTWTVPSERISAEPSETREYVYRYWGTAWATLGLVGQG